MASCNICTKRVLSHSFQLKCSVCLNKVHLKCLPFVSNDDSIYVEKDSNLWICTVCTKYIFRFNGIEENEEFLKILAEMQYNDSMIPFDVLIDQNIIFHHLN